MRLHTTFALIIGIILNGCCTGSGPAARDYAPYKPGTILPTGKLVVASGHAQIQEFNLVTGAERLLHATRRGSFGEVSRIDDHTLLVDGEKWGSVAGAVRENIIYLFDLETRKPKPLIEGMSPIYMSEHRKFLFLRSEGSWQERSLRAVPYLAELDRPAQSVKQVAPRLKFYGIQRPLSVSADEIIFSATIGTMDVHSSKDDVYRINLKTGVVDILKLDCTPILWRSATRQLLCTSEAHKRDLYGQDFIVSEYFLTSLDGTTREKIKQPAGYDRAIAYIPQHDAMLFNGSKGLTPKALLVYSFQTRKVERIAETWLGPSGAVWYQ